MGLLLSVLVACVGVIELITFYTNVTRNLTLLPVHDGDLSSVRENYIGELCNLRKRIANDLQKLQRQPETGVLGPNLPTYIPPLRLNSHEDIETELNEQILATSRQLAINPRRFLVTEKTENNIHRTYSPKRCVVSEESQSLQKSKHQLSLPGYLTEEQEKSSDSPYHPRYALKEEESTSAFDKDTLNEVSIKIDYELKDLNYLLCCNEEHKRPPSPYPALEVPHVPRNSIVNDLVNDPLVSVGEVEDEFCGSRSPSPYTTSKVIFRDTSPNLKLLPAIISEERFQYNTSPKRFRSKSESEKGKLNAPAQVKKTTSNNQVCDKDDEEESYGSFEVLELIDSEQAADNEEYLDCLDGVNKQECFKQSRISTKKIFLGSNSVEKASCSSKENAEEIKGITEVLIDAAQELEKVERHLETVDSSQNEERQLPEPFWVKY